LPSLIFAIHAIVLFNKYNNPSHEIETFNYNILLSNLTRFNKRTILGLINILMYVLKKVFSDQRPEGLFKPDTK